MNQTNRHRIYRFRDSTLTLEFADITTSQAQVLVSSDDSYLTMGGGVSAAIRRAGGNTIALDAAKKIPIKPGDVAVTTAGALRAHYVFHAITLGDEKEKLDPRQIVEKNHAPVHATGRCPAYAIHRFSGSWCRICRFYIRGCRSQHGGCHRRRIETLSKIDRG